MHPYDDVAYFPDNVVDLDQVANYCRNPSMDSVIDERPWCYAMDASEDGVANEFCDIQHCKGIRREMQCAIVPTCPQILK